MTIDLDALEGHVSAFSTRCDGLRAEAGVGHDRFTPIFDMLLPTLLARARRDLAPADAEDVVQETMIEFWKCCTRGRVRPKAALGLALKILRDRRIDFIRRRGRTVPVCPIDDRRDTARRDRGADRHRMSDLERTLTRVLTAEEWVVLHRHYAGYSLSEQLVNAAVSRATLGRVLQRGREKLRLVMEQEAYTCWTA